MPQAPEWLSYVIIYFFGAVSVGIYAKRLFENNPDITRGSGPNIVHGLHPATIGGASSYAKGIFFYIGTFELIYFIFCSSSILLSLGLQFAQLSGVDNVGFELARTASDAESSSINSSIANSLVEPLAFEAVIPLLVSSLIISLAAVPPISQIEHLLRSIAYGAAGVPQNLYGAIDKINSFKFEGESLSKSENLRRAIKLADKIDLIATKDNCPDTQRASLRLAIIRLGALAPWITGVEETIAWSSDTRHQLKSVRSIAAEGTGSFLERLQAISSLETEQRVDWDRISIEAKGHAENFVAVFALYSINNPNYNPGSSAPAINKLISHIHDKRKHSRIGPILAATIWGGIISTICIFVSRVTAHTFFANQDQIGGKKGTVIDMEYISSSLQFAPKEAAFYAMIFAVSAATALSLRENRIQHKEWQFYNKIYKNHYAQYLTVSVMITFLVVIPFYVLLAVTSNWISAVELGGSYSVVDNLSEIVNLATVISGLPDTVMAIPIIWASLKFSDLVDDDTEGVLSRQHLFVAISFIAFFVWLASAIDGEGLPRGDQGMASWISDVTTPLLCYSILAGLIFVTLRRQQREVHPYENGE